MAKETITNLIAKLSPDLEITSISEELSRFGGHPLRVILDGKETDFWSEFVRVKKGQGQTLVFRVTSRIANTPLQGDLVLRGVRSLLNKASTHPRIIVLDDRSNLEREIEPGTPFFKPTQTNGLRETYQKLLAGDIDVLLTPIREGALGPAEVIGNVGPFSEESALNDPQVWDISEEIRVAKLMNLAFSESNSANILDVLRSQISEQYQVFALSLTILLQGELQRMEFDELFGPMSKMNADLSFYSDQVQTKEIDLGFGNKKVEQVVAYPYPTEHGVLYLRLFRVWNVQGSQFEVVRVLQTTSSLDQVDGLRIDSSCIDGVHSLDCHCDCKAQLEEALYDRGLKIGENVVVIQMADHEGKGWGGVLKGSGTHRPVREYNQLYPGDPIDHVDVAAQFYNSLGVPQDNRNYGAAQAVVQFLGLKHVKNLYMDNKDKIMALVAAGVTYERKKPLYLNEAKLTGEANRVKSAKKSGRVLGIDGRPVLYTGQDEENNVI